MTGTELRCALELGWVGDRKSVTLLSLESLHRDEIVKGTAVPGGRYPEDLQALKNQLIRVETIGGTSTVSAFALVADRVGAKPMAGKPGAVRFTEEADKAYIARMQEREKTSKTTIARLEAKVAASKAKATADEAEKKTAAAAPQKTWATKTGKPPHGHFGINQFKQTVNAGAVDIESDYDEDKDRGYESADDSA